MQILLRRLYNGGFNHLKRASSLLYRAPTLVVSAPHTARLCATKTPDTNAESPSSEDLVSPSVNTAETYWRPITPNMSAHLEFSKSNESYVADYGDKGSLAIPPAKKLAIVTCMDARLNPFAQLGLKEGDAHIIRNAGGVAKDALRSIIISQRLLGTREIAVFHHTGCGMLLFTTPQLQSIVTESDPADTALKAVNEINFLEFSDLDQSVRDDVKFLKENPLILPETKVTGWVFEVETGKVRQIA